MAALLATGQPAGKASAEKSGDKNSDKIAAVAAAGGEGPAPRGEPSWPVLARLIRDVSFLQESGAKCATASPWADPPTSF